MLVKVVSRDDEVLARKLVYILYKTQLIVQLLVDYTSEETTCTHSEYRPYNA